MLCADDELIYAAKKDIQVIVSFQVEKDGIGLRGVKARNHEVWAFMAKDLQHVSAY